MRFQCQPGCILCCEQKGYVYFNREDIARLARHLGITRTEFQRRYLCGRAPLLRFRKPRLKQCPFLVAGGCSVHAVKPLQCSAFPFWPELLARGNQRREAASYCPGMGKARSSISNPFARSPARCSGHFLNSTTRRREGLQSPGCQECDGREKLAPSEAIR